MDDSQALVRRMWSAYREGGVETALPLLDPDVAFIAVDGTRYDGHEGVRRFFKAFEEQGQSFEASPYSFEGHGEVVLVAGHRRIHSPEGTTGAYLYFVHVARAGLIVSLSAHTDRDEALALLRSHRAVDPPGGSDA
jgi:ketosteroid isomerase-like protein